MTSVVECARYIIFEAMSLVLFLFIYWVGYRHGRSRATATVSRSPDVSKYKHITMAFGRYKSVPLVHIPTSYWQWLEKEGVLYQYPLLKEFYDDFVSSLPATEDSYHRCKKM